MIQPVNMTAEMALDIHRTMVRIRVFESRVEELFKAGRLPGFVHSYLGQEAVASGVCAVLRRDDYITSTHRGHGHAIAKGMGLGPLMAELYGKETGACRGRGGSMHVADFSLGMLGANGIVGGGLGIAAGAALSARYRGTDQVAVAFFGDGGINKGTFHEALNFAATHRLGAVYVCENNQYAQFTSRRRTTSVEDLSVRALAYGIPGRTVDGNDAGAVFEATSEAVERARRGGGPSLLVMDTYRLGGHYVGDAEVYRDAAEVEQRRREDPIGRWERALAAAGRRTPEQLAEVWERARAEVTASVSFAEESPAPAADSALHAVFTEGGGEAPGGRPGSPSRPGAARSAARPDGGMRRMSFGQATVAAMRLAMREDERVIVLGEDISWGGNFGQFRGLVEEFGPERVIDMPISEAIIVAVGVGAAVTGLRPVTSMSFVEFTLGAMDEIVNQASKFRYMFGGQVSVPLVLRASDGVLRSSAGQHSSSLEGIFTHMPGLKVVAPSNPADAKGLLRTAIADDDPVIYLENKRITAQRGAAPTGDHAVPLGSAAVRREGWDLTIVSYSMMAHHAEAACARLARDGIEAEMIDLRSLVPLDLGAVLASVGRTGRVLIAHEAWEFGGFGAELAASVTGAAFDRLVAAPVRVGAASAPIPFSPSLEQAVVPGVDEIVRAARRLMDA